MTDVNRQRIGLVGILVLAVAWAWFNRFVQDDAFISFRYARNLALGNGLVWNVGERVEGYTNFLWTLCMAPAFLIGADPVQYSYVVSLSAFVVSLVFGYLLASGLWKNRSAGILCVLLLGANYSFSSYATGGLETQFGIAWIMAAIWGFESYVDDRRHARRLLFAAVASAAAVMTRMDAVILLAPFGMAAAHSALRSGNRHEVKNFVLAVCLAGVPVAGWVIWRHSYYGAWVPNTFLIKGTGASWLRGIYYVTLFYAVYGFWLAVPVLRASCRASGTKAFVWRLVVGWAAWQAYVVWIGGDFMEFRMLMPSLPLLVVALSGMFVTGHLTVGVRRILVAGLIGCSLLHGAWGRTYQGIQSIRELKSCYAEWKAVAERLSEVLGKDRQSVRIAVTAAGIIPFYTECEAYDLLGLNDCGVARSGERVEPVSRWLGPRPGHVCIASLEQTVERGVNLLLNKPWVVRADAWERDGRTAREICETWSLGKGSERNRVHAVRVRFASSQKVLDPVILGWPLGDSLYLASIYLNRSAIIDDAIRRGEAIVLKAGK